jgi:hypothetical protein
MIGFEDVVRIAGSLIFRSQDKPKYRPAIYGVLACNALVAVVVVVEVVVVVVVVGTVHFRR